MRFTSTLLIFSFCVMAFPFSACSWGGDTKVHKGYSEKARINTRKLKQSFGGYYKVGLPYKINGVWYVPKEDYTYDKTGIASWYGPKFHRKRTANGERFNKYDMTAAHPTLPMPSIVRVTNLENGKSVKVRINDRGPFARNRIIDLSKKAAQKLDMIGQGTARVRVQYLDDESEALFVDKRVRTAALQTLEEKALPGYDALRKEEKSPSASAQQETDTHYIQVGAFSMYNNARSVVDKIRRHAHVALLKQEEGGQPLYKVHVGPYMKANDAEQVLNRIYQLGFADAVMLTN